ncbi:MAG TPA: glycosyltransferase [Candidatus Binatia bacterium]|nr:glycosyltransferase [Candidatus Binatia bacterium]
MPEPTVSVIVPVFNGEATIRTCLEALLAQDWPREALELIVVDNRSTDATQAVVAEYPVRLLEEHRVQSSYAARNRGVAASHGDLLAFTDADCVPDPGWVRALAGAFEDHRVGLAAGPIEAWRADRLVERYQAVCALRAERAVRHPVLPFAQTANAACTRVVFDAVGGFDAACIFGGDLDFCWRVQRSTGLRLAYEAAAVVRHRHRTTWRGLFALYEKNALANCLLAERWPHYANYPSLRTGAFLGREVVRSGLRVLVTGPAGRGDPGFAPLPEMVRRAGELSGWLRWRRGAVPPLRRHSSAVRGVAGRTVGMACSGTVARAHEAPVPKPHLAEPASAAAGGLALSAPATLSAPRP